MKSVKDYLEQLQNAENKEHELNKLSKLKWHYKNKKKKTIYLNIAEAIARFDYDN